MSTATPHFAKPEIGEFRAFEVCPIRRTSSNRWALCHPDEAERWAILGAPRTTEATHADKPVKLLGYSHDQYSAELLGHGAAQEFGVSLARKQLTPNGEMSEQSLYAPEEDPRIGTMRAVLDVYADDAFEAESPEKQEAVFALLSEVWSHDPGYEPSTGFFERNMGALYELHEQMKGRDQRDTGDLIRQLREVDASAPPKQQNRSPDHGPKR